MSVIITDMDMPKGNNCMFCEKDCFWQGTDVDRNDPIEDCPLKSVEGLIAKIESNIQETTSNCLENRDFNAGLYIAIEIIKEYCGGDE